MTGRHLTLEVIDRAGAEYELAKSLALKSDFDLDERRYEILRAVAWASTQAEKPVYIRTLLDRTVSMDRSINQVNSDLSDTDRRKILREQLKDLNSIGDLAELGNGYWVSVVGVFVEIDNDSPYLFASGIPRRLLNQQTASAITYSGISRQIPRGEISDRLGLPIVDLDLWSRRPDTDLQTWTQQFIRSTNITASEGIVTSSIEFYLPRTAQPGCFQSDRWHHASRETTGTYLYRQTVLNHWRIYGLAVLEAGNIRGTCEIDRRDAHRLMYGCDMDAGNPTTGTWIDYGRPGVELTLHNPVPAPEIRALTALTKRVPAKKYQYRFMATTYREQVRQIVDDLGIHMVRK
ncbi:hypothetical protein [Nocardia aurea]|uniref:hypothetical protein n=1 Tax=Nocardia aurea TaxID=2144174 RepID=UPI001300BAD2|nr:hypothetical protein [Nocardia aurea]